MDNNKLIEVIEGVFSNLNRPSHHMCVSFTKIASRIHTRITQLLVYSWKLIIRLKGIYVFIIIIDFYPLFFPARLCTCAPLPPIPQNVHESCTLSYFSHQNCIIHLLCYNYLYKAWVQDIIIAENWGRGA